MRNDNKYISPQKMFFDPLGTSLYRTMSPLFSNGYIESPRT